MSKLDPVCGDPLPFVAGCAVAASIWGVLVLAFGWVVGSVILGVLVLALWLHVIAERIAAKRAAKDRREAEERARRTW